MAQIKFIPILPKIPIGINVSPAMKRAMKDETVQSERLFKNVSDGFQNTNVSYQKRVEEVGGDLVGTTHTDNEIMSHLNFGTKIRWALMSNPYQAQTSYRSLIRAAGYGKPILRGRRAMQAAGIQPRPGIKAREFDFAVAKIRAPLFRKNMQDAINGST